MTSRSTTHLLPAKTKSRNGCLTCKERRLKCDESKPACNNCIKRNIECPGYQPVFKWPSKCQTNKQNFPARSRRKSRKSQTGHENQIEPLTEGIDESCNNENGLHGDRNPNLVLAESITAGPEDVDPNNVGADVFAEDWNFFLDSPGNYDSSTTTAHDGENKVPDWSSMMDMELFSRPLIIPKASTRTIPYTTSPQTSHGYLAFTNSPDWSILETSSPMRALTSRRPSVRNLLKGFYGVQSSIPQPIFHQGTKLVEYYFSTVSGIYSCFDSHLNPFRSFVGQMWTFSASMYYAIQSMAAAHLANDLPSMRKVGMDLHQQASQHLGQELSKYYSQSTGDEQALLVLLLLGLSAPWHRPGDLGLHYLRTARSLVHLHPAFNRDNGPSGPLQELFEEAMVYWEMMISFVANPSEIDVMHSEQDESSLALQLTNGITNLGNLDMTETPHPWTGISPQSQMLLARVGRLVRRVRIRSRHARLLAEVQYFRTAVALEENLLALEPEVTSPIVDSGDHCTSADHFITMAQVTRDCGLLELYRVFPALLQRRLGTNTQLHSDPDFDLFTNTPSSTDTHTSWLTSFAIHILQTLQSIPDSSSIRANQLLLLLIPAAELRLPLRPTPTSIFTHDQPHLQEQVVMGIETQSRYDFDDAELRIIRARGFARRKLAQLAVQLPAQPVRVMLELLDEAWKRMDVVAEESEAEGEDVFWVDVMVEKGWHTVMG